MNHSIRKRIVVSAFCITTVLCFGQQNRSAICRLGEIKNDSLLSEIQMLEINCDKDAKAFGEKTGTFRSLSSLIIKGNADNAHWEKIFAQIKSSSNLRSVVFDSATFESLPPGFEGLYNISALDFRNNEELNYYALLKQLESLPNLRTLNIDIYSIFDVPKDLSGLKNLSSLHFVNTDESISGKTDSPFSPGKEPVTYDYMIRKPDKTYTAIKYTAMAGEIDSDEYKELAKRFTTTFNLNGTTGYAPKYVNVKPPIKGIDVERKVYTINPGIENIITYPSGTKIRVPANAFTDKNGVPVTGSVKLAYREFRDPVDILVSGIPMKYDTAGETTDFESAGMFEMTASMNSEPVQLAGDKKIDVNFNTTSKDSSFNFYSFNDNSGNWNYLEKPKPVTDKTLIKLKPLTAAYRVYKSFSLYNQKVYDSTSFADRFTKTDYIYTNKPEHVEKIEYRSDGKKRMKSMRNLVRVSNVRRTKDGTVLFKVNYIYNAHPELGELKDVYFALNDQMSAAEFKQKYARRKYYNDVRINSSGADVEVQLKDAKSIQTIAASMVQLNSKGELKEINSGTKMKRYNKRLRNRERQFNRQLAKGKLPDNEYQEFDPEKLQKYAFEKAAKSMTAEEKKMTFTEWKDYCDQLQENERQWYAQSNADQLASLSGAQATATNLVQSLSLSGMGIYNCDQIRRISQPVEIFARYKTIDNKKVDPQTAYVIDKTKNCAFSYPANKIIFSESKKAENTLLAINEDGSFSIYRPEEFKNHDFRNKTHFDFVVTPINEKCSTVDDLRVLMGF